MAIEEEERKSFRLHNSIGAQSKLNDKLKQSAKIDIRKEMNLI